MMNFSKTKVKGVSKESFADAHKEVVIRRANGEEAKFIVRELGYMEVQRIGLSCGEDKANILAHIVAASVFDADGNQFTLDEVFKLKKSVAEPLYLAAAEVNGMSGEAAAAGN